MPQKDQKPVKPLIRVTSPDGKNCLFLIPQENGEKSSKISEPLLKEIRAVEAGRPGTPMDEDQTK